MPEELNEGEGAAAGAAAALLGAEDDEAGALDDALEGAADDATLDGEGAAELSPLPNVDTAYCEGADGGSLDWACATAAHRVPATAKTVPKRTIIQVTREPT